MDTNEIRDPRIAKKMMNHGTPCGKKYEGRGCTSRNGKEHRDECSRCSPFLKTTGKN